MANQYTYSNQSLLNRLMSHIKKTDDCWIWEASKSSNGYGVTWVDGKCKSAHRAVYELFKGKIPDNLEIDHLCRVRECVNPNHLEAVTSKENVRRCESPWGKNARKTHCKNGHEFTNDNIYKLPLGKACRKCRAIHNASHQARKRLQNVHS